MCQASRGVLGKGRSCPEGPVTPKCMSNRCPGSGWSRGPGALHRHSPSNPWFWEHHGKTTISGHSGGKMGEKDILSLVTGGTGQKTSKKSLTPRKGLKCAPSEGWMLPDQSLSSFQPPTLKSHLIKIQYPLSLTKSWTSSFFPVVPESFPDRAGQPLGAQSRISAVLQAASPCRNLRREGGDIMQ